jgi:hypothetical protein
LLPSRSPQALSAPSVLARAAVRSLMVVVGAVVGVTAADMLPEPSATVRGAAEEAAEEPAAMTSVEIARSDRVRRLVSEHRCWTHEAPDGRAGKFPGHVVVTVDGKLRHSSRLVGAALDHVFTEPRDGMVVHAFCP